MKLSARERQILSVLGILLIIYVGIETFARLSEAFLRIADVAVIFVAAWAFAYLLTPLVDQLDQRTPLNRAGAVFVVYVAIAVVFGGILVLAVPALAAQLNGIQTRGPELAQNTAEAAKGLQEQLDRAGVPVNIGNLVAILPQRLGDAAGSIAADALGFVSATAAIAVSITLRGCEPRLGKRMGSKSDSAATTSALLAENGCVKRVPRVNRFTSDSTWLLLS